MPLLKQIFPNISIWKNSETPQELMTLLLNKDAHQEKIESFKSEDRTKQYLTNRLLVQEIVGDYEIKKGANNKPFLEGCSLEISFSHNKDFTILMTSESACGIDVQAPTEKAIKIKSKFINDNDFCFENNDLETLSKVWSCKEAAFKKFGNNEIFLKENISVIKELPNATYEVIVTFKDQKHTVLLKQEFIENNYLFFTIN